jgi:flagellar basal body P-ring formation protein FlgA
MLAGGPGLCADTDGPPALILRSAARVDGAGIFLHQLLADGWAGPTNLYLAVAPDLNRATVMSRAQIAAAVLKHEPGRILTNWSGADEVRITRRTRLLEETELKELLTATLQRNQARDKGELELRLSRTWTPVDVPDEPLLVKVLEMPVAGLRPTFVLRFELHSEHEALGTWQVPLEARLWHDVWVARSPQPRGRLLREADLAAARRDLLQLRDALPSVDFTDSSLELAENLPTGTPLLLRSVRVRPLVHRGKVLDAVVEDGPLMITVKVEALEDGLPGQLIRVRNAKSKREFHGKVQNEQTVLVAL